MSEIVFSTPAPDGSEREVLAMIGELRSELRHRVAEPRRWLGGLRRIAFARAVQASNSIEGYVATLDDVVAAVDDEPAEESDRATELATIGYRDAMTYVLQLAREPAFALDESLLRALHFMMLRHELDKNPGRWRPGAIYVRSEPSGEVVYEGPEADRVPGLIAATIGEIERGDEAPPLVRGAMAHLNLAMIHPFSDGNGRMARCLQTLVLARERIVAPVFSSIEEYLGGHTRAYYDVLAEVGQGSWNPQRDARPWVRFCLTAHYRQARTHLRRIGEAERLWEECAALAVRKGLPERCAGGLADAANGLRLRNPGYRKLVEITTGEKIRELTASRDLKAMVGAGLLKPIGERRGRRYVAAEPLLELREKVMEQGPARETADPFELVGEGAGDLGGRG